MAAPKDTAGQLRRGNVSAFEPERWTSVPPAVDRRSLQTLEPLSADVAASAVTRRLKALLEVVRVSRERPIGEVAQVVVDVVERVVGFTTVVVNIYRPAWDDYQVVLVHGPDATREALMHTVNPRREWDEVIFQTAHEKVPGAFFLDAEHPETWDSMTGSFYDPEIVELAGDADRWRIQDGLFVALRASNGAMLGVLSLDVPSSGRRPSDDDLEMLVAVADYASLALENTRIAAEAERHRRTLADLLEVSSRLASQTTEAGVIDQACINSVPALGFETVTAFLVVGDTLELRAHRGLANDDERAEPIDVASLTALLAEHGQDGCALVERSDVGATAGASQRNGRGPLAWHDHRLVVPLHQRDGRLLGVFVFDNPVDRLLPDPQRRQALRLFAGHVAAAVESIDRQSGLEYLASHDPLTGVRNRRDLRGAIEAFAARPEGVSVLVCDLDRFKSVNDRFGHGVGDQVLEKFGTVLRDHARVDDVAVRTGGEEFCLVLPRIDAYGAMIVAERLRQATAAAMADVAPGLTVSIGTATYEPGSGDVGGLLVSADRAMYAAKAAGRDQCRSAETPPPR